MSAKLRSLSAIVLAAGKGTRMRSRLPKVLHRVCGQSLIERTLRALAPLELKEIVLVVGYEADQVLAEIARVSAALQIEASIRTVVQSEQRGTGHAAQVALTAITQAAEQVLILPGDVPLLDTTTLSDFVSAKHSILSCLTCELENPFGYGRVIRATDGSVVKIVEERDASDKERSVREVNSSIYLADLSFLRSAVAQLKPNNSQQELYLTDIVALAPENSVSALCIANALLLAGANTIVELQQLESVQRREIIERFMLAGVTFEAPETVIVDEAIAIGSDSFIGAGVHLKGNTAIGRNCRILAGCYIDSCQIADDCEIKPYSVLTESSIAADCHIGPFAHLRPATVLETSVKIGNFVETKKSTISHGAKVNHLSYVGDATVGSESNIGAGTITCNYDGKNKHKTIIEPNCFIGSNTSLVAPVTIGSGAVVGAGSTITKDVPKNALALGRAKQTVIENWHERKKG